ncbi:hypothetical protein CEUSTIGMA_g9366.t1 [Chlamydomonas eustigma]|uniref:FAD-dependent oxidoreductase 2 FAD binding domain-containing protein n=1 Tax=Chlamydomonas eustigma TaxID=1157962 RepID=A0A250XFT1_9CHLO|nr:hypothetical protein CEUSTIGMA_g9366.t1 [Chlamydomonas eustigma]|eukprot:GAX81938.1 hypothetical protein CEUSTIGMA_g9366.t1 [Chlamydomonas eustigma]
MFKPLRLHIKPGVFRLYQRAAFERCTAQKENMPHVTVIGGGAAGLTAAFFAAREGARVTVLERTSKCGTKILMSGGTRCNVLPMEVDLQRDFFTGGSSSAMRAVFASWPLNECKAWIEDQEEGVGLSLVLEQETLKYFPSSNSSKEVRDRLVTACMKLGVEFRYNCSVEGIRPALPPKPEATRDHTIEPDNGGAVHQHMTLSDTAGSYDNRLLLVSDLDLASRSTSGLSSSSSYSRSSQVELRARSSTNSEKRGHASLKSVTKTSNSTHHNGWECILKDGEKIGCDRLVLATGGLSFPGVGTDGTGHRVVKKLGHEIRDTYPALTPLTGPHPAGHNLAGLSLYNVQMMYLKNGSSSETSSSKSSPRQRSAGAAVRSNRTDMLFTHKGFSGPSVLDLSHHMIKASMSKGSSGPATSMVKESGLGTASTTTQHHDQAPAAQPSLCVNWTGESASVWEDRLKVGGLPFVSTVLRRFGIRERLADALCEELGLSQRKLSQLKCAERVALVAALTKYPLSVNGSEGYKKAEVTGGGVPLEQVDCSSMESRLLPGLFLCGEILDVFGRIGGYNFYWAWVSGRLAGLGAALSPDDKALSQALNKQKDLWSHWQEEW